MQVKAAEDLMALTRELKELWLFGQLDLRYGQDETTKADEDAQTVGKAVQDVLKTYNASS
jgi:hypothetical protein